MLLFQRECEAIDDGSQNFEKLGNAVESLGLVSELEENIVDRTTNIRPQVQEFAVNAMQGGFEEVAFPGVFGIKQLQQLERIRIQYMDSWIVGATHTWRTK